jgi:hypothetical protein
MFVIGGGLIHVAAGGCFFCLEREALGVVHTPRRGRAGGLGQCRREFCAAVALSERTFRSWAGPPGDAATGATGAEPTEPTAQQPQHRSVRSPTTATPVGSISP